MHLEIHLLHIGRYYPTHELLHRLRRHSQRSYRATSSYVWTREHVFSAADATRTELGNHVLVTRIRVDVGDNSADADVIAMMLFDLTAAVDGVAARVMQVGCGAQLPPSHTDTSTITAESATDNATIDDVLLAVLGAAIEESPVTLEKHLQRWGVSELDYDQELQGRLWLWRGMVHVVHGQHTADNFMCVSSALTHKDSLLSYASQELTAALSAWTVHVVEAAMAESWHTAVVAVPPLIALFLKTLSPALLHEAILYHCLLNPLHSNDGADHFRRHQQPHPQQSSSCVVPSSHWRAPTRRHLTAEEAIATAESESARIASITDNYNLLLTQRRCVRVVLRCLPRYVLALLLCADVPAALVQPLALKHADQICDSTAAASHDNKDDEGEHHHEAMACGPTQEELLLGIRITWSLQRWEQYLETTITASTRQRLKQIQQLRSDCELELNRQLPPTLLGSAGGSMDDTAQLRSMQKKLFCPYPLSYRGSSSAWILQYSAAGGELADTTELPQNPAEQLDAYLRGDNEDDTSSSLSGDDNEYYATTSSSSSSTSGDDNSSCTSMLDGTAGEIDQIFGDELRAAPHTRGGAPQGSNSLMQRTLDLLSVEGKLLQSRGGAPRKNIKR